MKLLLTLSFFLISSPAFAHDWYPKNCCHGNECQHAPLNSYTVTDEGIIVHNGVINPAGQKLTKDILIPFGDAKIKQFPPEAYASKYSNQPSGIHICTNTGLVRCIFIDSGI